ncbi:hypothetical protein EN792_069820, partial [Mesorhizobium sp. M00.F.Ca.ET.149.01.1.1]
MAPLRIYFDRLLDAVAPKVPRRELTDDERLALVRRHGDFSLAYSTAVQQKLSYFSDGDGYIAFATNISRHFALADPVLETPD